MTQNYWKRFWETHSRSRAGAPAQCQVLRTLNKQPLSDDIFGRILLEIEKTLQLQPQDVVLDLCCGTGRYSEALAAYFDAGVIGLDPSTKMLDQARKKLRDPRVRYQTGHGEAIPLADDSVDLIFMSMVLM